MQRVMNKLIQNEAIKIGDLTFDALTAGRRGAPMVLFLHGFPQTNYTWRHQVPYLAYRDFYCVAPNQRGYSSGARPAGISDYAVDLLIGDMVSLIEKRGYESAHVVGHDWGGQISWLLAARHPTHVKTLSVVSRPHPAAFAWAMANDEAQANRSRHHVFFQDPTAAGYLLENNAERLRGVFSGAGLREADIDAYLSVLGTQEALNAAINWYRNGGLKGSTVPNVTMPTLYMWGNQDSSVGRMAAEKTRDHVDGPFTFMELDGIGHFATDEVEDVINEALTKHITTNT